ncbi:MULTISPECIES: phosphatidylinositol mannoside acyltransferase [Streptomycetaceae]|uniref:Lipid A biosynthesis lauroyl acyltransferase n=1 Tax=Streptantibioticus cattleyicolor (strain ATCC 35852 / DSM 46488 / JCM 4925 / NBRC 14057 / NRRL 8057) TaxID=1003195 RepID=F8K4U6_STREN|nr:phosphatidylinositol mannoside acyltransferase [Streptantibioticus cattleyicolor]AEW97665.1 lipid A biosynthesis lauroyl acyltransferase [Streptantibioticus cattleyicolor NRRL 8057 = DSM 46488]MYS62091.1 phosphatidylinositol mannoside acyltransferase [Streptomyces sp. SID5468]CCB77985.1 putative acyltransferase [Streptantibioticus cattleyicolor NRRL 8057 = DSM 46488]
MNDKLSEIVYGAGWSLVKRLPESAAAALGRTVADATWRRRGPGVLRLEANYARVVPDAGPQRLAELSRAGLRSYLRYWMESFRLPVWSKQRIRDGFAPADVHLLQDALAAGRGVILALPHMGNYDLAGAWVTTKLGVPFTTVAQRLKPESVYDRFVAYREGLGMEVLPHTGGSAFGTLARRLRDGGLVCLVADRDLSASGIEVDFFGEPARMPAGPAMLSVQTGAVLLPVTLWYDDSPVLQGRVHPPVPVPAEGTRAEKAAVMTQAMADAFASGIAAHPTHWHMMQKLWLSDLLTPAADGERSPRGPVARDTSGEGARPSAEGPGTARATAAEGAGSERP